MAISGAETIATVSSKLKDTLLAFSCGKDAIAAWLAIREHFDNVIPYYLYLVPGLEFVEDSLQYYEKFFATKIVRIPHPSLYRWLNSYLFQSPERCLVIEQAGLQNFDYRDVRNYLVEDFKLNENILAADGVRAADSPMRSIAIQKHGPISWNLHRYHPVWDWNKQRLIDEFRRAKIKLPVDYKWFGRTFDGLDLRFLLPLKRNAPRDYQRVLDWFPMADLEIFRYEHAHG